ncbi:MAG TPA: serine protease [Ferrovibrio sp.]|uniref:serine protease n=1 Tax=Ferrovibrio sp. TaxID=1917215 RepID=UPI002ED1D74E
MRLDLLEAGGLHMMNKRILILGLVLPLVGCANPLPVTPPVIEAKPVMLRSATVLIESGDSSHGSGFIVSRDGLVITNQHVVGGQHLVRVKLLPGRIVIGEVMRNDERRDVALLKLDGGDYPAMPIRESPVRIAEEVYAVGAPQREALGWTVARGVVSAYRQAMPPDRLDVIQADMPIHGGNSGGPLLDRQGNVVGIAASAGPWTIRSGIPA